MFLLSLFLVLTSVYLYTSVVMKNIKSINLGLIFFFLIAFAQIVLTFEILSLFSIISEASFLIVNIIFLLMAVILWHYKKYPIYKSCIKNELKSIIKALKKDKLLFFISFCFLIFIIFTLLSAIFFPVNGGDALSYYFPRGIAWIQNGNFSHYLTSDARELIMPINMDLMYTYLFLFRKTENGVGIFPFIFFIMLLYVLYNFIGKLGFSRRKRLWSVFSISSFCLIGIMAKAPCSDIAVGTLLLTSIFLVFSYLKEENIIILFFAALSASLSFGVKTTAFIAFPSFLILMVIMIFLFKKPILKKTFIAYLVLLFANFCIFSAYNYILNYLQFSNPFGSYQFVIENRFNCDYLGYLTNLVKSSLMFFDVSGLSNFDSYNNLLNTISSNINFSKNTYIFPTEFIYNSNVEITSSGLGILGIFLFLPALFISFANFLCLKKIKSNKKLLICLFGLCFIFNFLLFCYLMVYTSFNMRYFMTFVCLSSPILVFTYIKSNKNLIKYVFCYFMLVYMVIVANKSFYTFIFDYLYMKISHPEIHGTYNVLNNLYRFNEEMMIAEYIKQNEKPGIKIAEIANENNHFIYDIEKISLLGYKIDKLIVPTIENSDIQKYDYLISNKYKIDSQTDEKINDKNSRHPFNCKYIAINLKETDDIKQSLSTTCDIPFEYYEKMGFEKLENLNLNKYIIYKNTKINTYDM